jgi:hypothetical protein
MLVKCRVLVKDRSLEELGIPQNEDEWAPYHFLMEYVCGFFDVGNGTTIYPLGGVPHTIDIPFAEFAEAYEEWYTNVGTILDEEKQ